MSTTTRQRNKNLAEHETLKRVPANTPPAILIPETEATAGFAIAPLARHIKYSAMVVFALSIIGAIAILAGRDVYLALTTHSGRLITLFGS